MNLNLLRELKLKLWLLLVISTSFFTGIAQKLTDEETLYARVGFKGGMNYANVQGDLENPEVRTRVHLGVLGAYPVTRKFFIQGELLYSAQGYTMDVAGEKEKIGLNYISLPLVGKYYLTPTIALETGPQFSLLSTVNSSNDELENNDPFYNTFNEFETSWIAGVGYWMESGLFFQLRYHLGLSNVNNTDQTNTNKVAQFSIGYLFRTENNRRIFEEE